MKLTTNRTWIAAGIGFFVALVLAIALRPQPIGIDIASVTVGQMSVQVEEEGRTRVKNVFIVSAPIVGRVLRPTLDVGDPVVKGKTVVAVIQPIDPPFLDLRSRHEIEAQVKAASAAVELAIAEQRQAESELEFAESELLRIDRLAKSGTAPARTLQKAQLEAVARRAGVSRAQAQVELRRRQLDSERSKLIGPETPPDHNEPEANCCVSVVAPASGRILKRLHESEKVVTPGTALLEIGDTSDMEIVVELLSTDAVKVRPGAAVTVSGWGGDRVLRGRVRRIEPGGFTKVSALGIEEQRVRAILEFVEADTSALGHDYRVYTAIITWQRDHVLQAPLSALFRNGAHWAVFVVRNGRAVRTNIEVGHRNAEAVEIVNGLTAGDTVILHPSDRITDNSRVQKRLD